MEVDEDDEVYDISMDIGKMNIHNKNEIKETMPQKRKIGYSEFEPEIIKKIMRPKNENVCQPQDEMNKNMIVLYINQKSFCFSRNAIFDIFKKPALEQDGLYSSDMRNRDEEKKMDKKFLNVFEHYYFIESLNLCLKYDFKNLIKTNRVFKLVFDKKINIIVKFGNTFDFTKDEKYLCNLYNAIPMDMGESKNKNQSMDVLVNEMNDLNIQNESKKAELNYLSDLLFNTRLSSFNDRYKCDEKTSNSNLFIFEYKDEFFCLTINEVVYMIENYLAETSVVITKDGFDTTLFNNAEEKFFRLPFTFENIKNFYIDDSIITFLKKKNNSFKINNLNLSVDLSSVNYSYKNCDIYSVEPFNSRDFSLLSENLQQRAKKFDGEVFFKKEFEKGFETYMITYRTKKYYMFRNDLPDRLTYDTDNQLIMTEWHQNNDKNAYRNGSNGLPGRITFYPETKTEKRIDFFDDDNKNHSYNAPSVIINRENGTLEKEEFHNHGVISKIIFYNEDNEPFQTNFFDKYGKIID